MDFSCFSYGGKSDDNLTSLRYAKFMEAVTTSLSLNPENLHPTERAIFFHVLRVHLQIAQWKLLDVSCLNPLEWGWKTTDPGLEPVKTDLETAPEKFLQFIHCKFKLSSKNCCDT